MQFPTALYRCPGLHQCQGGTFSQIGANDQAEFNHRIAEGWFATLPEAIAGKSTSKEAPASNAQPTRAELEQKAIELGIKFDGRTSDKKLGHLISAALKG